MSVEAPLSMALLAGRLPPGSAFAPSGMHAITTASSAPGGIFKDPAVSDFKIDETVRAMGLVAVVHELTAFSVRLAKGGKYLFGQSEFRRAIPAITVGGY